MLGCNDPGQRDGLLLASARGSAEREAERRMKPLTDRLNSIEERLDALVKIERAEVAEIHPGDTVILHVSERTTAEEVHRILDTWEHATGYEAVAFQGGVRVEIQRKVDE